MCGGYYVHMDGIWLGVERSEMRECILSAVRKPQATKSSESISLEGDK